MLAVRITQKRLEAEGVVSLRLRGLDTPLPAYEPGAHVDLETAPGVLRQYSLCGHDADANEYEIAVLREPVSRGGSAAVHDVLQVGKDARISEPRNHFPLEPRTGGRTLLFAGGIGVTPIMAMAEFLAARGEPFEMHYCARSSDRMAYAQRLKCGPAGPNVQFHLDDGPDSQKLDIKAALGSSGPGDHLYICGPAGFITAVLDRAAALGWPEAQVHREFFAAPASADQSENRPFRIEIGSSGLAFMVGSDSSVAKVLEENGIFIPTSCAEGICGTCVVGVLQGEVDHRDFLFSDAEHASNTRMTACCSRAKSDTLVLDL